MTPLLNVFGPRKSGRINTLVLRLAYTVQPILFTKDDKRAQLSMGTVLWTPLFCDITSTHDSCSSQDQVKCHAFLMIAGAVKDEYQLQEVQSVIICQFLKIVLSCPRND